MNPSPKLLKTLNSLFLDLLPRYPSRQKILGKPWRHPKVVIEITKEWKKYACPRPNQKQIIELLTVICAAGYQKTPPDKIIFDPRIPSSCYYPAKKLLILKDNSIITALHELAHHLYGASELTACRWSVWLFKKVFPKAYAKLKWKGHMLYARK